jgi:hypothetical protein
MLAITSKVKLLKEELFSAKHICKDIIGTLNGISEKTDYRKELGIFALQAPDWKILTDEKRGMIETIRKLCTGEMSPEEAQTTFSRILIELERVDSWVQVPKK